VLSPNDFLVLSPACVLKRLEAPCVYNVVTDELYEANEEGFEFLALCDGSRGVADLRFEEEFVEWCLDEGILSLASGDARRTFKLEPAPAPSLRYLELQVTGRCNLKCRHCYLGKPGRDDLPLGTVLDVLDQFERMQGLRLLISGGEPLLHPDFWGLNEALPEFGFRSILLTNGTLIDSDTAERLAVHEVQVSLDGVGPSHDALRGPGTFARALAAVRSLLSLGKDVSVATMVHAGNIQDFPQLEALVSELGIREWNVDVPCAVGALAENTEFQVPYEEAAPLLEYGFGGGVHTASMGLACGAHLCAVLPSGKVAKCGFFASRPAGDIDEGLRTCWERVEHMALEELECDCEMIEDCRGGCRFRALLHKDLRAPDPVQCRLRGVAG